MVENRGNKWSFEDLASFIIIGFISRLIGFILRTIVISLGLISLLFVTVAGFAVYVFWIAAPLVIISLLGFGIAFLVA